MRKLRIASYNIRKSIGLDWKRKPQRIQEVLGELHADVVLLQEADRRLGARAGTLWATNLREELGYQFVDLNCRPQSHGWHGNAILYRSPLQPMDPARIRLPKLEPRGAVSVVFDLSDQLLLRVIGTHLSVVRAVREKQLTSLMQGVAADPFDGPTVIGGDFNERRPDDRLTHYLGDFQLVTPGPSFHSARPLWSLDRFAIRGGLTLKGSFVHTSVTALRASDHLPVCMDIELPP
jgi:endonuclease/exonuclease/phosphatase family metal-dependent hydrolase